MADNSPTTIPSISEEEWHQWVASGVTEIFKNRLIEAQNQAIEQLLNADPAHFETTEQYAMRCITLRSFVDGLAQATDFESAKADLVIDEETSQHGY